MAEEWARGAIVLEVDGARLEADVQRKVSTAVAKASGPSSRLSPDLTTRFAATAPGSPVPPRPGASGAAALGFSEPAALTAISNVRKAIGALAAVEIARPIISQIGATASAFRDFNEQLNAVQVTFDENSGVIEEFAKTAASTIGASEREVLQSSTTFGAFFNSLNLGTDVAARLSRGLLQLSGDFASLRNLQTEESQRIFLAGLAGEGEPLRRRGVLLDEQRVKQKAVALGLSESGKELDQQAKILSRVALIYEQTGDAQGDFARTSDQLANQQRALQANTENLQKSIGRLTAPVLTGATNELSNFVQSIESTVSATPALTNALTVVGESFVGGVIDAVAGINPITLVLNQYRKFNKELDDGKDTTDAVASSTEEYAAFQLALNEAVDKGKITTTAYERAVKALNDGQLESLDALDKAIDAQLDLTDLQLKVEGNDLKITTAKRRVSEAQTEYNEILKGGGDIIEKQINALDRLRRAEDNLTDAKFEAMRAEDDLGESREAVIEQEFRFGAQSKEADEARDDLLEKEDKIRRTQNDVKDATVDLAEAREENNEAMEKGKSRSELLARASEDLRGAQLNLKEAYHDSAETAAELEIRQREANGETLTGIERAEIYRTKLLEVANTVAPGSDFYTFLTGAAELLKTVFPDGGPRVLTFKIEPPQIGAGDLGGPGTIDAGTIGGTNTTTPGGLSPGAVGVGALSGGTAIEINQYSPTDPLHTAAEIAWRSGI